jgi:ribosomal protein S18 acetylase RimI-like enzyme
VERDGFVFAEIAPAPRPTIRELDRGRERAALRALFVELQDSSWALDPAEPPGDAVADAYLPLLFQRCDEWRGRVFVAEQDGRVAGFVSVLARWPQEEPDEPYGAFAYVADLVVLPEARRAGLGRALLAHAEAFARAEGAAVLRIDVMAENTGAHALYRRFGFRDRTIEMEKILDPGADAAPPGGRRAQ